VSHDREFLNQITNKIVEVEKGYTYSYPHANYNSYLIKRNDRLTIWRDRYNKQQKRISEELHWLKKAKNNPSITANTIKSRENALRRYQSIQHNPMYIPYAPPRDKRFQFRFPIPPRYHGEILFEGKQIRHGYGDGKYATLFEQVNFEIRKGNRIGFVGPNGSGNARPSYVLLLTVATALTVLSVVHRKVHNAASDLGSRETSGRGC
jgi:ATP-binding cassette subfamily F protein 3